MFFLDKNYIDYFDELHSDFEDRIQIIGKVGNILTVIYTERGNMNRILGDIAPEKYLKKIMTGEDSANKNKKNSKQYATELVSEENLEIYLRSHFIDMEDLENDNFKNFICHRAKKILKEICKVTGKEFSEPSDEELKQIFLKVN